MQEIKLLLLLVLRLSFLLTYFPESSPGKAGSPEGLFSILTVIFQVYLG